MASIHRLSMNTSLKNARIFDDDAWDDSGEFPVRKIKVESPDSYDDTQQQPSLSCIEQNECKLDRPIKQEKDLDTTLEEGEFEDSFNLDNKDFQRCGTIKTVCSEPPSAPQINCEAAWMKINKPLTPSPPHISDDASYKVKLESSAAEHSDHMFDHSPYNKELLKNWRIKETTPIKTDEDYEGPSSSHLKRNCFKSARRTMFNRPSPYETGAGSIEAAESRVSIQHRHGIKRKSDQVDFIRSKHRASNMETDSSCLARREKQIEYGKNTIGYENYLKLVPKSERKPEDPQTPPKYKKYSRRGWEGLIKQWRIKLHQYDPPETPDS